MVNAIPSPDRDALAQERKAGPVIHHAPEGFSDQFALGFTKVLRFCAVLAMVITAGIGRLFGAVV